MFITQVTTILKGTKIYNQPRFCYIEFENCESVAKSLQLHGKEIKGRKMHIDFEDSGPKKGFKYRTENPSKFNKDYNNILQKKRKRKNN